jgi:hypothetical protein
MKIALRLLVIVLILMLALGTMGAAPAATSDLQIAGLYKGIDTADGSKVGVKITEWRGVYQVQFTDQSTSACGGGAARGKGGGVLVANALHTYMKVKCVGSGLVIATNYDLVLVPTAQNILVDVYGRVFTLVKGPGCRGR